MSLRGAVSIARRLQDPLAELVKIDPKSIGVGQYQHDVTGTKLERSLDAVVEDAVNAVGVDVNTASRPLLARVSGITDSLAGAIVAHRDARGAFGTRDQLKDVPRLGPKAFEQCAGFLRIRGGGNPLDSSGVHPEAYPVVRRILERTQADVATLIGNARALRGLDPRDFTDEAFGLPTVNDILKELEKPGRDPRPEFQTATFAEGVHTLGDLEPGMVLEGVVTNVAAFGAFVDIGVHQDGLVHVSAMSSNFVADPRDVAKPGDVVKVKVLSVDIPRNRISLTMRLREEAEAVRPGERGRGQAGRPLRPRPTASRTGHGPGRHRPRQAGRQAPGAAGDRAGQPAPAPRPGAPSRGTPGSPGQARPARPGQGGGAQRPGSAATPERGGGRGGDRPPRRARAAARRRPGPSDAGGDRRGAAARVPAATAAAAAQATRGDRRGGGAQGADRRNVPAAPANSAMAEALRRAGLVNEKGNPAAPQDRRTNRP